MLLATALALLITGCAPTDVYCSKQTGSSSTKTITHHFFVSGIGQKKAHRAAKICGGAENVVKTRNPANIRKWIARFYYFGHLYSRWRRHVLPWLHYELPSVSNSYLHCSLIYFWVPSSCFCIVISLSLRVKIIRSAVSASRGRLHYPRRRRWWLHA